MTECNFYQSIMFFFFVKSSVSSCQWLFELLLSSDNRIIHIGHDGLHMYSLFITSVNPLASYRSYFVLSKPYHIYIVITTHLPLSQATLNIIKHSTGHLTWIDQPVDKVSMLKQGRKSEIKTRYWVCLHDSKALVVCGPMGAEHGEIWLAELERGGA